MPNVFPGGKKHQGIDNLLLHPQKVTLSGEEKSLEGKCDSQWECQEQEFLMNEFEQVRDGDTEKHAENEVSLLVVKDLSQ